MPTSAPNSEPAYAYRRPRMVRNAAVPPSPLRRVGDADGHLVLEDEIGGRRVALLFGGAHQREPRGVLGVRLVVGVASAGQAGVSGDSKLQPKPGSWWWRMRMVSMTLLQSSRRASSSFGIRIATMHPPTCRMVARYNEIDGGEADQWQAWVSQSREAG